VPRNPTIHYAEGRGIILHANISITPLSHYADFYGSVQNEPTQVKHPCIGRMLASFQQKLLGRTEKPSQWQMLFGP